MLSVRMMQLHSEQAYLLSCMPQESYVLLCSLENKHLRLCNAVFEMTDRT